MLTPQPPALSASDGETWNGTRRLLLLEKQTNEGPHTTGLTKVKIASNVEPKCTAGTSFNRAELITAV